jgi:hypothetical protein
MLGTLLIVVFTYLFAATHFDAFLYPDAHATDAYFRAAALPGRLFDVMVAGMVVAVVLGWVYLFAATPGRIKRRPARVVAFSEWLYVLLKNQLYLDRLAGPVLWGRRPRGVSREPRPATAGLALALHAASGALPFAVLAVAAGRSIALGAPLAVAGISASWLVATWFLFDLTHEAMYGR